MSAILNRFVTLQEHIFSVFASSAWISEQLAIVPKGYQGSKPVQEYIEFNPVILGAGSNESSTGVLFINIYTDLAAGPRRAAEIADILDRYLSGQSFSTSDKTSTTQFLRSTNFQIRGASPDSKAFILSNYQIQFGFFRKEI